MDNKYFENKYSLEIEKTKENIFKESLNDFHKRILFNEPEVLTILDMLDTKIGNMHNQVRITKTKKERLIINSQIKILFEFKKQILDKYKMHQTIINGDMIYIKNGEKT